MNPLILLLLAPPAQAQDAFDAHGFNLAALDGDVRDPLEVLRAGRFQQWDWFAGGAFEFAKAPLVLVTVPSSGESTREVLLDNVFGLNTSFGVAVHDRVRLDAAVPLFFASTGDEGAQGAGFGDARLTAMVSVLPPDESDLGFGLGVAPYLDVPIGAQGKFLGDEGVGGGGTVAASYATEQLTVGADVGLAFRPAIDIENLNGSDGLVYGAFVNYLPSENLGVTLESRFESPFKGADEPGTEFPAELLLSARSRYDSGAFAVVGGSVAMSRGASAALWRLFLGGGFGRMGEPAPKDADLDGILDKVDACPNDPETVNAWRDEDGCPDALGALSVVAKVDGREIAGASFTLTGPDGSTQTGTTTAPASVVGNLLPNGAWQAKATAPECYAGQGIATTAEGVTTTMEIPLQPVIDALVKFEVVDERGNRIPRATVTWEQTDAPCAPVADGVQTLANGAGEQKVGAGVHRVYVTAPEFSTVAVPVTVQAASEQTVRVQLAPTKVRMTSEQIVILEKVFFEVDSDVIKTESYTLLDEVSATIMANPQLGRIEVAGHTDSDGSDQYNLELSQRRVESVRNYLIGKGVDGARLVAKGYGESAPIASNKSKDGKAKNRRVEFNILGEEPKK